jgi:hypothetical protein
MNGKICYLFDNHGITPPPPHPPHQQPQVLHSHYWRPANCLAKFSKKLLISCTMEDLPHERMLKQSQQKLPTVNVDFGGSCFDEQVHVGDFHTRFFPLKWMCVLALILFFTVHINGQSTCLNPHSITLGDTDTIQTSDSIIWITFAAGNDHSIISIFGLQASCSAIMEVLDTCISQAIFISECGTLRIPDSVLTLDNNYYLRIALNGLQDSTQDIIISYLVDIDATSNLQTNFEIIPNPICRNDDLVVRFLGNQTSGWYYFWIKIGSNYDIIDYFDAQNLTYNSLINLGNVGKPAGNYLVFLTYKEPIFQQLPPCVNLIVVYTHQKCLRF